MPDGRVVADLDVRVWRGDAEGELQRYFVPRGDKQTVLDVVTCIQCRLDPTFAYRFACRVGMCGSCAMTVNGKPRWTCWANVDRVAEAGRLELRPLRNMPVIKDLAVDMTDFFEKFQEARGRFVPTATREVHWLIEMGIAQALCIFEVEKFGPFLVESDLQGNGLFDREGRRVNERTTHLYDGLRQPALRRYGETTNRNDEVI